MVKLTAGVLLVWAMFAVGHFGRQLKALDVRLLLRTSPSQAQATTDSFVSQGTYTLSRSEKLGTENVVAVTENPNDYILPLVYWLYPRQISRAANLPEALARSGPETIVYFGSGSLLPLDDPQITQKWIIDVNRRDTVTQSNGTKTKQVVAVIRPRND